MNIQHVIKTFFIALFYLRYFDFVYLISLLSFDKYLAVRRVLGQPEPFISDINWLKSSRSQ